MNDKIVVVDLEIHNPLGEVKFLRETLKGENIDQMVRDLVARNDPVNTIVRNIEDLEEIHIEVGNVEEDGTKRFWDAGFDKAWQPPKGREVVVAEKNPGRFNPTYTPDKMLLAKYKRSEFCDEDLRVIFNHQCSRGTTADGKVVDYFSFTHEHFLETLRARKLKMMAEKGIDDDGTYFGTAKKTIIVPEQVIPEHEEEIYVEWVCWDDEYQDEKDFEMRL
jgi:hypothetical protein